MVENSLSHEYDPAKRHERYLKNRKLKGRSKGSVRIVTKAKSRAEIAKERHAKLEAQVDQLKARLEKLQAALKILVEQAKARSGVKPTKKTNAKEATKQADAKPQKLTPQQKKAKAEADAKRYREEAIKNGTATNSQLSDEVKSLNEKIKTIQARIEKMRTSGSIGSQTHTTK